LDKICKIDDNYNMESRHQNLGWHSLKVGMKGEKASPPPKHFASPKHSIRKKFEDGNLKKCFSNFDVKL
jgi:hypothetical protein